MTDKDGAAKGKVVQLPGTKPETREVDCNKVLQSAIDENLDDVLIVGWKDDQFFIGSSHSDVGELLYLLERAKDAIMDSATR